ncbi:MAG: cysteine-rich CWC family protein [Pseudomonadota bacterium]
MPLYQQKRCPRCGRVFDCNSGAVGLCRCREMVLTPAQREYIAARHDDCLCRACLAALREECAAYGAGM